MKEMAGHYGTIIVKDDECIAEWVNQVKKDMILLSLMN